MQSPCQLAFSGHLVILRTKPRLQKQLRKGQAITIMKRTSNCACHGKTSALILSLAMSSQGEHIGKELQIIIMPTRPLNQIGIPTHLSTVGVPFKKECQKFQRYYDEVERHHPSGIPYKEHVSLLMYCSLLIILHSFVLTLNFILDH